MSGTKPTIALRAVANRTTKAPAHLRNETQTWFSLVVDGYELEPHHIRLLVLASESWDRALEARETLEAEGSYFTDRFGCPKAHPAVQVERDSRTAFARLLRELDLDGESAPDPRLRRRR